MCFSVVMLLHYLLENNKKCNVIIAFLQWNKEMKTKYGNDSGVFDKRCSNCPIFMH